MEEARVTAVIVNWNGQEHLEECLPSLAAQDYPSLEIIVVDNGSVDGSEKVVREAGVGWVPLGKNIGLAPALNEGAAAATGEYLLFLNNDMRFAPNFVTELVLALEANPRAMGVDAQQMDWDGAGPVHEATYLTPTWRRRPVSGDMVQQERSVRVRPCLFASAANVLVRRDRFEDVGGWDGRYPICFEDFDLGLTAWSRGWPMVYVPTAVCWHRVGASTSTEEGQPLTQVGIMVGQLRIALKFFPWSIVARTFAAHTKATLSDLVRRNPALRLRLSAWRITLAGLPDALQKRKEARVLSGRSQGEFLKDLERKRSSPSRR